MVLRHVLYLHRAECPQPNVQRQVGDFYPFLLQLLQQLLGKVQSGGRRRRRTHHLIVDRLVPLVIFQLFGDIGRQGRPPHLLQHGKDIIPLVVELYPAIAALQDLQHLGTQQSVSKNEFRSGFGPFAGADHRFPFIVAQLLQQQKLNRAVRLLLFADQSGGHDPAVIDRQHISRVQIVKNIGKNAMRDLTGPAVEYHQAAAVAPLQRRLGNQLLRQIIIIVGSFGHQAFLHGFTLFSFIFRFISIAQSVLWHNRESSAFPPYFHACRFFLIYSSERRYVSHETNRISGGRHGAGYAHAAGWPA